MRSCSTAFLIPDWFSAVDYFYLLTQEVGIIMNDNLNEQLEYIIKAVNAFTIVVKNMESAIKYNTHLDCTNWLADDSGLDPEMLANFDATQKTLLDAYPPNRISKKQLADILSII